MCSGDNHLSQCDRLKNASLLLLQTWPPGIQCQICHMTFSDQSAISAHYDTAHAQSSGRPEHPDARHECEVCGRKFTAKKHLYRHMRTVHRVGDVKTFKCDICSKTFTQKSSLKSHLETVHNSNSRFRCDICGKGYARKIYLQNHLASVHKN